MRSAGRPFARLVVLAGITLSSLSIPTRVHSAPVTNGPAASSGQFPTARSYYPEVRLRKLHLVRPDLIPYPIAYEIYC